MRILLVRTIVCFAALLLLQSHVLSPVAWAGEKEERIQALQEKMARLQSMLTELEEQKLREQPPEVIPWQPLVSRGEERRAYGQYAYLVAPQMPHDDLSAILEQLYFTATRDSMTRRGTLFVIPALTQTEPKPLAAADYNRSLAAELLNQVGMPSALSGGLLVMSEPPGSQPEPDEPALYLDLAGCPAPLRAHVFELLLNSPFDDPGDLYSFIGKLVAATEPQVFQLYRQRQILWLSASFE